MPTPADRLHDAARRAGDAVVRFGHGSGLPGPKVTVEFARDADAQAFFDAVVAVMGSVIDPHPKCGRVTRD